MKLIAFSAWKRSGKDCAADYLIKTHGAERRAFADPLKDMVCEQFGLTRELIDDPKTKEAPLLHMPVVTKDRFSANNNDFLLKEFRHAEGHTPMPWPEPAPWDTKSQVEVVNQYVSQLFWTPRALCIHVGSVMRSVDPNFWVKKALASMKPDGFYVLSDLRYRNEADTMKAAIPDLITIRINRFETCESQDPSERDLDNYKFDVVIKNEGTLEELYEKVGRAMV